MPSPHRRSKPFRGDPLGGRQFFELELGPKKGRPSAFADEDELRAAWEANRDEILQRHAFRLHHAGWRPEAFWYLETGDPSLATPDDWRDDEVVQARRLRWLVEHDGFLPGELAAMRRRAEKDPNGYAAAAWRIVSTLKGEAR